MRRIYLPTLEGMKERGGVARYIEATAFSFPEITVHEFSKKVDYPEIFRFFWSTRAKADLYFIHHLLPVGTVAYLLSYLGGRPYVIFLHGMDFDLGRTSARKRWLTLSILRRAKQVVVNSEALRGEVEEFLARGAGWTRQASPVLAVYPPVGDALVEASRSKRKGVGPVELKELLKLASGALGVPIVVPGGMQGSIHGSTRTTMTLLTVSRLVERKGHLKVLEALERLPGVKYRIIGDGPMRERIEAEIMHRGLTDRVTLETGVDQSELPAVYESADIFVMPTSKTATDREGFGIVYVEAQLFGLPVVAVRHPGVDEAVEDDRGGILIDDSVDELVNALKRLIDDPKLRARLGSDGRSRVLANFTREKQMEKLRDLVMGS